MSKTRLKEYIVIGNRIFKLDLENKVYSTINKPVDTSYMNNYCK